MNSIPTTTKEELSRRNRRTRNGFPSMRLLCSLAFLVAAVAQGHTVSFGNNRNLLEVFPWYVCTDSFLGCVAVCRAVRSIDVWETTIHRLLNSIWWSRQQKQSRAMGLQSIFLYLQNTSCFVTLYCYLYYYYYMRLEHLLLFYQHNQQHRRRELRYVER